MFEKLEELAKNNKKISDFHIRTGWPLAFRQTGEIHKLPEVVVKAQDLQDLISTNCNEVEMKKFNDLKIHLYGGWYGYPLINLLLTKFLNIEHITNIDLDEKALDLSRKYTQTLELEHKVFFKHRDVKDKIETSYYKDKDVRLVINTSSEHMADLPDLIANKDYTPNCVFALQSNNMFHVKDQHINCSNNLDEFVKKTGLT